VKITKGEALGEERLEGVEYTGRIGALHCDLSVVISCTCNMRKGPVTLAFAGSGDSMLYSNLREASEVEALWNSCSELRVAHREHRTHITLFEIVRHVDSGVWCGRGHIDGFWIGAAWSLAKKYSVILRA